VTASVVTNRCLGTAVDIAASSSLFVTCNLTVAWCYGVVCHLQRTIYAIKESMVLVLEYKLRFALEAKLENIDWDDHFLIIFFIILNGSFLLGIPELFAPTLNSSKCGE
jgi:hypothetical protein